jgi:hypothetical protein
MEPRTVMKNIKSRVLVLVRDFHLRMMSSCVFAAALAAMARTEGVRRKGEKK